MNLQSSPLIPEVFFTGAFPWKNCLHSVSYPASQSFLCAQIFLLCLLGEGGSVPVFFSRLLFFCWPFLHTLTDAFNKVQGSSWLPQIKCNTNTSHKSLAPPSKLVCCTSYQKVSSYKPSTSISSICKTKRDTNTYLPSSVGWAGKSSLQQKWRNRDGIKF